MDALLFLLEVPGPVGVEVAVAVDGAELEDGLGAVETPSGSRYVHPVFDNVAAGAFDDPGRDGPAGGERGGVVKVRLLSGEIGCALVGALAFFRRVTVGGGAAPDARGDLRALVFQDLGGLVGDPFLGGRVAGLEETPGGAPQVFQDVNEVNQDRDLGAAAGGFGFDGLDLLLIAVDERDPGPLAGGVAAVRLGEPGGDDGGDVIGDRRGQPFPGRDRGRLRRGCFRLGCFRRALARLGDDIGGGAGHRLAVMDAAELGHPLSAVLLSGGQAGGGLAGGGGGGGAGGGGRP